MLAKLAISAIVNLLAKSRLVTTSALPSCFPCFLALPNYQFYYAIIFLFSDKDCISFSNLLVDAKSRLLQYW